MLDSSGTCLSARTLFFTYVYVYMFVNTCPEVDCRSPDGSYRWLVVCKLPNMCPENQNQILVL